MLKKVEVYGDSGEFVEDASGDLVSVGEVLLKQADATITPFTKSDVNGDGYSVPSELTQIFMHYTKELFINANTVKIEGESYHVEDRRRFKRKMALYIKRYR